jgi:hypothetical protein
MCPSYKGPAWRASYASAVRGATQYRSVTGRRSTTAVTLVFYQIEGKIRRLRDKSLGAIA